MDLLRHFKSGEPSRSAREQELHMGWSDSGGGHEEHKDIGRTNPMFAGGSIGQGDVSFPPVGDQPQLPEDLTRSGSYRVSVFHEACSCIVSFPCNAEHASLAAHDGQVVNRVVKVDTKKLTTVDEIGETLEAAADFLQFPDDTLLKTGDLSLSLSWSGAVYSERFKSVYAFPSNESGKVLRVSESMQLQFIGDPMNKQGLMGADTAPGRGTLRRSASMSRPSMMADSFLGDSFSGNSDRLFAGGCVDPETGNIFAIPFDANRLIMIIPIEEGSASAGTVRTFGEEVEQLLSIPGAYVDAVFSQADGNIYLIPGNAARVLRINLDEYKAREEALRLQGKVKRSGSSSRSSVVGAPRVEAVGPRLHLGDPKFSCGIHGGLSSDAGTWKSTGFVYCIPDRANYVYRIGPISKGLPASKIRVESIGGNRVGGDLENQRKVIDGRKYSSAVFCELTKEIFCIPEKALKVLCIRAQTNSSGTRTGTDLAVEIGTEIYDGPDHEYCGAVLMDGGSSIYAINSNASEVLWIMPIMRVVERVPQEEDFEDSHGKILPPLPGGNNSFFAVFDHDPSFVQYFPSRLMQLTVHKIDQPWLDWKDIDHAWRDIHLLVMHGGPNGSLERHKNALYYDSLLDGLIQGLGQQMDPMAFSYTLEELLASLLNRDNANEYFAIHNCWLAIRPFLDSIARMDARMILEKVFETDAVTPSQAASNAADHSKSNISARRGSRLPLTKKESGSAADSAASASAVQDGVAACFIRALFEISSQLNMHEIGTDFDKEEFDLLCKRVCEVLYDIYGHRLDVLKHELDELYPAKDKAVFSILLKFEHIKDFLVVSGACKFLATSEEMYRQIAPQETDHAPSFDHATELYFDVLVSVVEKHTLKAKKLQKSGLSPGMQLKSLAADTVEAGGGQNPMSTRSKFLSKKSSSMGSNISSDVGEDRMDISSIKRLFNTLDLNGDGNLSKKEIQSLLGQMGVDMKTQRNLLSFEALDHDKNGRVDFDEFLRWYAGRRNSWSTRSVRKIASYRSQNGDSATAAGTVAAAVEGGGDDDDDDDDDDDITNEHFTIEHYYNPQDLVREFQMAVCNVLYVGDHAAKDGEENRRKLRRAIFRALCCSSRFNVKKMVLVPTTTWSTPVQVGPGGTSGSADWFRQMVLGGPKRNDFNLLVEYFVLSAGIGSCWTDTEERDKLERSSSELALVLSKMDNIILTTLLRLPKATRHVISQTSLAEEMVTMCLKKPLALMMHLTDICGMAVFVPVYTMLCYYAILDKKIPGVFYGESTPVYDSVSLKYVYANLSLLVVREIYKVGALASRKMFQIYLSDGYNIIDIICIIGGFFVCGFLSNKTADCTLPRFRVFAALVSGLLWLKILGIIRILSVDFASFLSALYRIGESLESFLIVFGIFIVAFGQMFVLLFEGDQYVANDHSVWVNWSEAYLATYRMMLGDFNREWFRTGGKASNIYDDDLTDTSNSQVLSLFATILFILNQFVVSIVLVNVLIAIVSKAYQESISKGRIHFLSARLNIAALYGAMGLTRESKANIMLDKARKRILHKARRCNPDLFDSLTSKKKRRAKRTAMFRPNESGTHDDSDDEEAAASQSRHEIKMELKALRDSLLNPTERAASKNESEVMDMLVELKREMQTLREEVSAIQSSPAVPPIGELRPEIQRLGLKFDPNQHYSHSPTESEEEDEENEKEQGEANIGDGGPSTANQPTDSKGAESNLADHVANFFSFAATEAVQESPAAAAPEESSEQKRLATVKKLVAQRKAASTPDEKHLATVKKLTEQRKAASQKPNAANLGAKKVGFQLQDPPPSTTQKSASTTATRGTLAEALAARRKAGGDPLLDHFSSPIHPDDL